MAPIITDKHSTTFFQSVQKSQEEVPKVSSNTHQQKVCDNRRLITTNGKINFPITARGQIY
jgi:hypothetical protein